MPSSRVSWLLGQSHILTADFLESALRRRGRRGGSEGIGYASRESRWGARDLQAGRVAGFNGKVSAKPAHGYTYMGISKWLCVNLFGSHLNRSCTLRQELYVTSD